MTDPFSAIAGVLGILSSVITLSNTLTRIVDDFNETSNEIRFLSRDIHQFFSVIRSLDIALREQIVQDIVESDEAILDMISNLAGPLQNYRSILTELMVRGIRLNPAEGKSCTAFRSLKWSLVTKSEVRSIQLRLEATKSTLISAQIAVSILVTVRSHGLLVEQSSQKQHDCSALHTLRESTDTSTVQPEDQVLDFVMSLVHQTYHAIISDDPLLCHQVARIYRQLDEKPMQMQQLKAAIAQAGQRQRCDRADTASDVLEGIIDQAVGYNVGKGRDSSTADVFLGSVSMFSMNDPNSSIDRLRGSFSGSPD